MAETPIEESSDRESQRQKRWRAPLVTLVIYLLTLETWSGFAIFFVGPFLESTSSLGAAHWWLGVGFLGPYGIYQLRHYLRVRFPCRENTFSNRLIHLLFDDRCDHQWRFDVVGGFSGYDLLRYCGPHPHHGQLRAIDHAEQPFGFGV